MNFALSLAHYFFPRESNNHKARVIHTDTIFLFALFLVIYRLFLQAIPITGLRILGYAANIPAEEVIKLTNQKREELGLPPLTYNPKLAEAARKKGEHMLANDYWAHVAPDGTEPWKFFIDSGYRYKYAGENLARDFTNALDAVNAWLASPSHRENLLSEKYKEIGVAVIEGDLAGLDTTLIVQFFGTQQTTQPQVPIALAKPTSTPSPTSTPTPFPTNTFFQSIAEVSPALTQPLSSEKGSQSERGFSVLISPFDATKSITIATTTLLLAVLIIDGIIVWRRRIPRVGGRTFAHIVFLGMILAVLLMAKGGSIL